MKYTITTMLHSGILDNAGKAVTGALKTLGFKDVQDVRIGRTYELECEEKDIEKIERNLPNEVMEDYRIE